LDLVLQVPNSAFQSAQHFQYHEGVAGSSTRFGQSWPSLFVDDGNEHYVLPAIAQLALLEQRAISPLELADEILA